MTAPTPPASGPVPAAPTDRPQVADPGPRLILHVGMGKTGTSAIQKALRESADALPAQGAEYLGMVLRLPGVAGPSGQLLPHLHRWSPAAAGRAGQVFAAHLAARGAETGVRNFILSHEGLIEAGPLLAPFLGPLYRAGRLRVLIWVRDPRGWLPSAHAQWAVRHKTLPGMVQPLAEAGPALVRQYNGVLDWNARLPGAVEVRPYRPDRDIVAEFAAVAGIDLPSAPGRFYARLDDAELVLRALYNSRQRGEALPDPFDAAVRPARVRRAVMPLNTLARTVLDYSATDAIIADHAPLFDRMAAEVGVDPRAIGAEAPPPPPQQGEVRRNLVDYLAALTLDQADRIAALEGRLAALEARLAAAPAER